MVSTSSSMVGRSTSQNHQNSEHYTTYSKSSVCAMAASSKGFAPWYQQSCVTEARPRCGDAVWWPEFDKQIRDVIIHCEACIVAGKGGPPMVKAPCKPIKFTDRPCSKLALDILGEWQGNPPNARLVVVLIDLHFN